MPRTPTISLKKEQYETLKERAEKEGHPSVYAYMKDLIIEELRKPLKL